MTDQHRPADDDRGVPDGALPGAALPGHRTPDRAPSAPRRAARTAVALCASVLTVAGLVGTALVTTGGAALADTGCADGPWSLGDISVQGRPDQFAPGVRGRTFVWHDGDGWHLRSTDATPGPHVYTGTITPSSGASIVDIRGVRLDPHDRFVVGSDGLHYTFTTHRGVDGVDFRVTGCRSSAPESLTFALRKDGHGDDPQLIDIGDKGAHPGTDPFTVRRSD